MDALDVPLSARAFSTAASILAAATAGIWAASRCPAERISPASAMAPNLHLINMANYNWKSAVEAKTHHPAWKTLLAFAIIYFVWGSTFLAIRVGVREVPPFLLAAMRFLIAGAFTGLGRMDVRIPDGSADFRPGLRTLVLGRA